MKLFSQSDGMTPQLKTASVSCLVSSTPSSQVAFTISDTMPDEPAAQLHFISLSVLWNMVVDTLGRGQQLGGGGWVGDLREVVWLLKFDTEQPRVMLNPCLHLVFVSEHKLTSIIKYTV